MRKFTATLMIICLSLSLAPSVFAANKLLDLTQSWQLTSDLDLKVSDGDILIIDGTNQYYIYEMGGVLINTGEGFAKLQNTILYPSGKGMEPGSIAAF